MLDSRKLLKGDKLSILIDSQSLDAALTDDSPEAFRLLSNIARSNIFEPLRSPLQTKHDMLSRVTNFDNILDGNGRLTEFRVVWSSNHVEHHTFGYNPETIEQIARGLSKTKAATPEDIQSLTLVLIWIDYKFKRNGIMVTENPRILQNRLRFERHCPRGDLLNIVNASEALEIMDIFAKSKRKYTLNSRGGLNKGYWYFVSFRSKVPHYHTVSSEMLDALGVRFTHLLQSIDEMGFQYYSGAGSDTMSDTLYHFNYFISMVTGIFDNLAIETREKYNIIFKGDNIPSRISLQNNAGGDFLKEVRNVNSTLRQHIQQHVDFINLIYKLRELILHRKGLEKLPLYTFDDGDEMWSMNFIVVDNQTIQLLKACGDRADSSNNSNILSLWGMRKVDYATSIKNCLEPYRFSKSATLKLAEFSDHYLELLGFGNFINTLQPGEDFHSTITAFRNTRLGF